MERKYNLREESKEDVVNYLNKAPSRMYEIKSIKNDMDHCYCPGCPCADLNLPKAIYVAGLGVFVGTVGVLTIATAGEIASKD